MSTKVFENTTKLRQLPLRTESSLIAFSLSESIPLPWLLHQIKNTLRQISFVEIKQVSKQCDVIYAFALHIPLFVFYSYFHNIKTTRTFEHQGEAWRVLVLQRYYIIFELPNVIGENL